MLTVESDEESEKDGREFGDGKKYEQGLEWG